MGFFSKILDKLGMGGGGGSPSTSATPGSSATTAQGKPQTAPGVAPATAPTTAGAAAAPVKAMAAVDVAAELEKRASGNAERLNWRTSIVDLLKLLDIDSSLAARKELATELGCPPALMEDSAKMNMWLHKTVLAKIAANGGQVPKELLD
jgi:hypothetical protein